MLRTNTMRIAATVGLLALMGSNADALTFDFDPPTDPLWVEGPFPSATLRHVTLSFGILGAEDAYLDVTPTGGGIGSTGANDNILSHQALFITCDRACDISNVRLNGDHVPFEGVAQITRLSGSRAAFVNLLLDAQFSAGTTLVSNQGARGGSAWAINADSPFYLKGLDVAPIPLPAGAPLLIGALGLLGFIKRKKA